VKAGCTMARVFLIAALLLAIGSTAGAYNDQQHQGMTAIAYKAMVGAALENGCNAPIDFAGGTPSEHIDDYPGAIACNTSDAVCQARWADFLQQNERAIRYLRGVDSFLAVSTKCPPGLDPTGPLGQVPFSVNPDYFRSANCGVDATVIKKPSFPDHRCSAPALLCDPDSIYQYIAPDDHTGDILGYWATEADHDLSTVGIGIKPVLPGVGHALQDLNTVAQDTAGALLIPLVCGFEAIFGGDDCLNDAKSLADDVTPIDDIDAAVPVLFPQHLSDFLGLWHFIDIYDTDSPCDDVRGMLYERAGPQTTPDALDMLIMIGTDLGGLTLDAGESKGTQYFSITNPTDGDPASCRRERSDWEFVPFGHLVFSPVDNLGLYGWQTFLEQPGAHEARSLGWPLHAIGDSVAPHHVTATTGWGHRPFEDSAEQNWGRILYQDVTDVGQRRTAQYAQLRRILLWGFGYWQAMADLRAARPGASDLHKIPIRAFVTRVASDTYAETTDAGGAPGWPFDQTLSVPYFISVGGLKQATIDHYKTDFFVTKERALLERGAGAILAFLSSVGQLGAPFTTSARCGTPGALFGQCGAADTCDTGCCVPAAAPSSCNVSCSRAGCPPSKAFCPSTCGPDAGCDTSGCCVPTACNDACTQHTDCAPGAACDGGCCGPVVN